MAAHLHEDLLSPTSALSAQMIAFAGEMTRWPTRVLDSYAWGWDDYTGVRYAPLHATMALRALAGRLHVERAASNKALTLAQHALAEHQAAFRDMQAMLLGISPLEEGEIDTPPAPGEWPVRTIVMHVHEVERYFLATILNALDGGPADELNPEQVAARTGEQVAILPTGTLTELWAEYARVHAKVQAWLVYLSDEEVHTLSTMWESTPLPILFRMQRLAAHVREHTNQLEKTLRVLDRAPGEGQMLARQLLAALAEVEGLRLGMGTLGVAACDQLAHELAERFAPLQEIHGRVDGFNAGVAAGDVAATQAYLTQSPGLAYTHMDDGVSALLFSLHHGNAAIVAALRASGMRTTLHEASALGEAARVERILGYVPDEIDAFSSDGYTPLQLASYYGRTEVVSILLAHGANVHAVARNAMAIQPLHAAVAGNHYEVARMLLDAGADANATQAGGFTPIMAATQHKNAPLAALLRAAGALDT